MNTRESRPQIQSIRPHRNWFRPSLLVAALLITGCEAAVFHEVRDLGPQTGDAEIETQTAPAPILTSGRAPEGTSSIEPVFGYVAPDRLRGRATCDQPGHQAEVVLDRNDKCEIRSQARACADGSVQCRIVEASDPSLRGRTVLVDPRYLNRTRIVQPNENPDRYFMIQNIATEKVRIYERCQGPPGCSHKLVLETDMTAGEDTPEKTRRTILGSYAITRWAKFYEDVNGLYPSWFDPTYPSLPAPGADLAAWTARSLLPSGRGVSRGSFGWYTALIGPNAETQWTHGTFGWGADGARFIHLTRDAILNHLADPRSHGCTRLENRAIAFMRELMPRGSKLIKIYAREAIAYPEAVARLEGQPPTKWPYILTKDGVREDGRGAGLSSTRDVPESSVLERGEFELDQLPNAISLQERSTSSDPRVVQTGNLYNIPVQKFRGVFYVDTGRVSGYEHPAGLEVGGYNDLHLPGFVRGQVGRPLRGSQP